MSTLEDLRIIFASRMVRSMIEVKTPPSKFWPVPDNFKAIPTIMEAILSKEGYEIYTKLSEDEQRAAISFVENFGPYISEIIGCPLFDDWDKTPIEISDEKKQELRDKYKLAI
jgi:hypothetical protein